MPPPSAYASVADTVRAATPRRLASQTPASTATAASPCQPVNPAKLYLFEPQSLED